MTKDKQLSEVNPDLRLRKSYPHDSEKTNMKGIRLCSDGTYFAGVVVQGVFWGVEGFRTKKEASAARKKAKQEMIDKFGTPDNAAVTAKKHDTWVAIGQNSGRAWYICSPQGEKVQVSGIPKWAQENAEKFDKEPTESNCQAIAKAFYRLKRSYLWSSRYPNYLFMPKSYCGWYLEGWEDEFGLHSTYGPPLRGDLLDAYEAIRQPYIKRMRAASRKNAYEKNRASKREAYYQIKAETGHGPRAVTDYYTTYFDCNYKPVTRRGKPAVLRSPDGELISASDLAEWIRNNCEKHFDREPTPSNVKYIRRMLGRVKGRKTKNGEPATTMGGWSVLLPEDVE